MSLSGSNLALLMAFLYASLPVMIALSSNARMPVVIEPDQFTPWLENQTGLEILKPAAEGVLQRWPVSKRVNSSKAAKRCFCFSAGSSW